jgi:hypothetical protein
MGKQGGRIWERREAVTHHARALFKRFLRIQPELVHGEQNPPVNWFQPVPDVR